MMFFFVSVLVAFASCVGDVVRVGIDSRKSMFLFLSSSLRFQVQLLQRFARYLFRLLLSVALNLRPLIPH
jgi:hypothetical protein